MQHFKIIIHSLIILLIVVDGDTNEHRKKEEKIPLALSENVKKEICSVDLEGPKLVILLSFGSSGSNEIWNIMGKLTGENKYDKGFENDEEESKIVPTDIIEEIDTEGVFSGGKEWLLNSMCERQKENPNAYFVGFKWTPKNYSQTEEDVLEAIKSINVPIKVVRLHRNILIQLVSENKKRILKKIGAVPRCRKGDESCAYVRKQVGMKMHLQTDNLIAKLDQKNHLEFSFDHALKTMKIPHIDVQFHNLLIQDDVKEWSRILNFLGKPQRVTLENRNKYMKLESVSIHTLEDSISNYEEVRDTLKGSNFDFLLY